MQANSVHVDRDDKDYWLSEEYSKWASDVFDCELLQVDFDFFLFGVDTLSSKGVKGKQVFLTTSG